MDVKIEDYLDSNKPTIIVSLTKRNHNKDYGETSYRNGPVKTKEDLVKMEFTVLDEPFIKTDL